MKKKDHDNAKERQDAQAANEAAEAQSLENKGGADAGDAAWSEWGPESAEAAIERVGALEAELEETKGKLLRTVADYQNSQRRALQNEQQAKADGISRVASDVAVVLDHLDLALGQDMSKVTAEQIIDGVRVIREELLKVLARHGVTPIHPKPNDEFVPGRHEAVMQQAAEGIDPGRVVATFQPGFLLTTAAGERVVRPAKVSVSPNE